MLLNQPAISLHTFLLAQESMVIESLEGFNRNVVIAVGLDWLWFLYYDFILMIKFHTIISGNRRSSRTLGSCAVYL